MSALAEVTAGLAALPEPERKAVVADALTATRHMPWCPTPGPQVDAFYTLADETFYGGQAGGGKTDLGIGLALTQHKRSLILRRINKDALKIVPRIEQLFRTRDGFNGQLQRWRLPDRWRDGVPGKSHALGRQLDIAGCELETDKQRFKGDPHDLIVFDEGTDFVESQYRFIIGWNRSVDPGQRCRVLVTSNPPTTAEGLWVIRYWGPWLDPTHPNPARPGELRWFTTIAGEDREVLGPGPHEIAGEPAPVTARSRTYIPASLRDNPELADTGYASVLAGLPAELRRAYDLGQTDEQTIETDWGGRVPQSMLDAMMSASGVTGQRANALTKQLRPLINIPWETAIAVHRECVLPRWEDKVRRALPNCDKLPADCFGALVSLTFNRGPSFNAQGDRYREMRNIKAYMTNGSFALIPNEFRDMKRLWPDVPGLLKRREREASLFERGLKAPRSAPQSLPAPVPLPDVEPVDSGGLTKPAVKSKINWAAIGAFAASLGGLLTDWRVAAVVITGLLLGFIIWNRSGKPDIAGWLR